MRRNRLSALLLVPAVLACLTASPGIVVGAPARAQTAADRAALAVAIDQYQDAKAQIAGLDARMAQASLDLDTALAEESQARTRMRNRALAMYRSPDDDFVSVLLGATTFQDFLTRWDVMARIARQDAANLQMAREARRAAERSANELLELQEQSVESLDALSAEVERARRELAKSEAALREYEARTAAATASARAADSAPAPDATQRLRGRGAWLTARASHYGRNFSGTGADGSHIGPYSMIVAHKTLPFGTLIEFEYNGRRAVARVADRGPYTAGRVFDLGPGVVRTLGFSGVHEVRYRIISQ